VSRTSLPRLIPTGTCWCGCGKETSIGAFFARGHDKIAEAALTAAEFGGSVPQLLHKYGYGPGRPVIDEAVNAGVWTACEQCWYRGTLTSVATHQRKFNENSGGSGV
jgi:hypothetical protein